MISKIHRLAKKKDFETVFKRGKSAKSGFLAAKVLITNKKESRFGFVISKKTAAKAVVRNTIRRRLKSAVSSLLKEIEKPVDVVIIALPGAVEIRVDQAKKNIVDLFKKTNIM